MKELPLLGAASLAFISGTAAAADLAVRPAPMPPPDVVASYNWTGFYVGLNVGYGVTDNSKSRLTFDDQAGPNHIVNPITLAPSGWLGGFQAGLKLQFGGGRNRRRSRLAVGGTERFVLRR